MAAYSDVEAETAAPGTQNPKICGRPLPFGGGATLARRFHAAGNFSRPLAAAPVARYPPSAACWHALSAPCSPHHKGSACGAVQGSPETRTHRHWTARLSSRFFRLPPHKRALRRAQGGGTSRSVPFGEPNTMARCARRAGVCVEWIFLSNTPPLRPETPSRRAWIPRRASPSDRSRR